MASSLEPMQLHQLRYMVCVAEERRFTRAAARLHVAQPSVSSAISALEQELGAPLFHRARSEVVLTGAGEAFLPWARQVLADCEAGAAAVRDLMGLRRGRLVDRCHSQPDHQPAATGAGPLSTPSTPGWS